MEPAPPRTRPRLPQAHAWKRKLKWDVGKTQAGKTEEPRNTGQPSPLLEGHCGPLPFTHKAHTGLVQVDGFAQGLSPCPNLGQLTRQVLHQGQQLSSDVVSLQRMEEEA